MRRAFTLVELLIVIAVIAVLSVIVILILNPAEIIRQSRDSNRVSDLTTLKTALSFYETQGGSSLGNSSTSYVSIFDPSATSSAGDQCQGLSLPSLPGSWTYHCAASSSYKNIDGTGWVPVNFSASQLKPPIAQLPVDPVNTASTGYYFTYTTNGTTYEMTASLESQKYASTTSVDGGQYSDLYETGSNLALAPYDYAGGGSGCAGGHNGFLCSRAITMSGSAVSGTLSNFPLLFSGTYSYLAASSSAGNVQNGNGYDIVFASDSGCSSRLNFEQESYTSSTGNIIDWVKVPSITGGTAIYLCYGNSSISTDQSHASSTWNVNYQMVQHLPNGSTLTALDSTGNAENGTISTPAATGGQIGGGASFGGSDYISVPTFASTFTTFTISTWINLTSHQANAGIVFQRGATYVMGMDFFGATNHLGYTVNTDSNTYNWDSGVVVPTSQWAYLTVAVGSASTVATVCTAGTCTSATNTNAASLVVPSVATYLGEDSFGGNRFITGKLDEVRISNTNLSPSWVMTEYNNQSSPSTFYTVGAAM